jgi:hypothetical protein
MKTFTSISFSFILGLMLLLSIGCNSNTAPDDGLSPFPTPSGTTSCGKASVTINGTIWVATDLSDAVWAQNTGFRTLTLNMKGGDGTYVKLVMKDVTTSTTDGIAIGAYSDPKTAVAGSNTFQIFHKNVKGETIEMAYGHLKVTANDKLLKTVSGTFDFDDNIVNTKYSGLNGSFAGVCYK